MNNKGGSMYESCPNCGGEIWDNREENEKRIVSGKPPRPDFSCKDKNGCKWVKWGDYKKAKQPENAESKALPPPNSQKCKLCQEKNRLLNQILDLCSEQLEKEMI